MPGQPAEAPMADRGLRSMGGNAPSLTPEQQPVAPPLIARLTDCPLTRDQRNRIAAAIARRDYKTAETELVSEIDRQPSSAELLNAAAGVFFIDGQFLNVAIALKKSDHIRPLSAADRLTLALAYIALNRGEWARAELDKLVHENPKGATYLYWLARIDYDERRYSSAAATLKRAIDIDPNFTKAYDNLGLALEANGDSEEALTKYDTAVKLNRKSASPSPWPPLNRGSLLSRLGRYDDAAASLKEALRYGPELAPAHFRLGFVYDKKGDVAGAIAELREAASLDEAYADPLYALGRIYYKEGDKQRAEEAFEAYRKRKSNQKGDRGRP
jgi:superkiller protein 3